MRTKLTGSLLILASLQAVTSSDAGDKLKTYRGYEGRVRPSSEVATVELDKGISWIRWLVDRTWRPTAPHRARDCQRYAVVRAKRIPRPFVKERYFPRQDCGIPRVGRVELLPGEYIIEFAPKDGDPGYLGSLPWARSLAVELEAGNTYTLHFDREQIRERRVYFWIEDAEKREVVAGTIMPKHPRRRR